MTFESKVKQINHVEKDVDKVLKAARLERNPKSNERFETILFYATIIISMLIIFGFLLGTFLIMAMMG